MREEERRMQNEVAIYPVGWSLEFGVWSVDGRREGSDGILKSQVSSLKPHVSSQTHRNRFSQ